MKRHAFLIQSLMMKPLNLDWRIVLVRPRNPLNVGAAARATANFGMRDLVVVAPYEPVWQEARSAVGAEEVLQSARAVPSLLEAVCDCMLVVGTTAGSRRSLDRDLLPLSDFPAWLQRRQPRGRAALLFGSEKTGLSNEHLSYCHVLVRIPTAAGCPSMNLGQAVAVCTYELARAGAIPSRPPRLTVHRWDLASVQSLDHVFERAVRVLDQVGYLKPKSRNAMLRKLRRLLLEQELTNHDARILGAVLAQIEWGLARKTGVRSQESE
jgi:tRNA/rRNA methyltransferase